MWQSADPAFASYLGGRPNGGVFKSININSYRYASLNPVRYNDPTGMFDEETGTIESGDTLSAISKETNVSVDIIMKANPNIKDRDTIFAGDTLRVPGKMADGKRVPPIAPPGVDIDANMSVAAENFNPLNPFWFKDQVKNKGPWDYKQLGSQYEAFGNFHYGATGAAFGFKDIFLLNEAGKAQVAAGTSRPEWGEPGPRFLPQLGTPPYGDDPADQYWIQLGIDFYDDREQWHSPSHD